MSKTGLILVAIAGALLLIEVASLKRPTRRVLGATQAVSASAANPAGTGLALNVQRKGRALRVLWSRNAVAVRQADHAILQIVDGTHNTHLELNAAEASAGRLVYWPETDRVIFRLEAFGPNGMTVGATQFPGGAALPVVAQNGKPAERKPSPFAQPRWQHRVQKVSVPVVAEAAEAPAAPKPEGSFFGRLAGKIPLVRSLRKSGHGSAASSD